jgi:pre-mycofactocin synthase
LLSSPVLISPTRVQAVHPYWVGTRDDMAARMERAKRAGAVGMIVTLDWTFSNGRDWGSPYIPQRINLEAARRYALQVLVRPARLYAYLKAGHDPDAPRGG